MAEWIVRLWLVFLIGVVIFVATGCELVRRAPIETARLFQEVEKDKAETQVLLAHAEVAHAYALCLSARFAKDIPTVAEANKQCGNLPVSPVTVAIEHSRRVGDVSALQVMPPIPFLGALTAVLGEH